MYVFCITVTDSLVRGRHSLRQSWNGDFGVDMGTSTLSFFSA